MSFTLRKVSFLHCGTRILVTYLVVTCVVVIITLIFAFPWVQVTNYSEIKTNARMVAEHTMEFKVREGNLPSSVHQLFSMSAIDLSPEIANFHLVADRNDSFILIFAPNITGAEELQRLVSEIGDAELFLQPPSNAKGLVLFERYLTEGESPNFHLKRASSYWIKKK